MAQADHHRTKPNDSGSNIIIDSGSNIIIDSGSNIIIDSGSNIIELPYFIE